MIAIEWVSDIGIDSWLFYYESFTSMRTFKGSVFWNFWLLLYNIHNSCQLFKIMLACLLDWLFACLIACLIAWLFACLVKKDSWLFYHNVLHQWGHSKEQSFWIFWPLYNFHNSCQLRIQKDACEFDCLFSEERLDWTGWMTVERVGFYLHCCQIVVCLFVCYPKSVKTSPAMFPCIYIASFPTRTHARTHSPSSSNTNNCRFHSNKDQP